MACITPDESEDGILADYASSMLLILTALLKGENALHNCAVGLQTIDVPTHDQLRFFTNHYGWEHIQASCFLCFSRST